MNNLVIKLAITNIKNHKQTYIPYLLTCIGMFAMAYIICALAVSPALSSIPYTHYVQDIMSFGAGIIYFFAFIFLFYTHSFLIKRRKKEFGVYNILGMEKRHILLILLAEALLSFIIMVIGGLIFGILAYKLMVLIVTYILHESTTVAFGFEIPIEAILTTLKYFSLITVAIYLSTCFQVMRVKPIELLSGSQVGEKEPKANWFMAIVGVIALGIAYYLALTTQHPVLAFAYFMLSVVLVIIATYALFNAGSIVVLKLLRKNKNYYYQTQHFISVSSMLYRMKQNAVGLANICILSTMVLVMVSSTLSLYLAMDNVSENRFPLDTKITTYDLNPSFYDDLTVAVTQVEHQTGMKAENVVAARSNSFQDLSIDGVSQTNNNTILVTTVINAEDYTRLTGEAVRIKENEVLFFTEMTKPIQQVSIYGKEFEVVEVRPNDDRLKFLQTDAIFQSNFMIVSDSEQLEQINQLEMETMNYRTSSYKWNAGFNLVDADAATGVDFYNQVLTHLKEKGYKLGLCDSVWEFTDSNFATFGGMFFLGIFLGLVFVMATVLIIYYKQVSEGYEDQQRYCIMQKVGLSQQQIRKSINGQILIVFFLPLVTAAIHVLVAQKMIGRILSIFGFTEMNVYLVTSLVCIAVFALFYTLVYQWTAHVYYKIVKA